MFNIFDTLQLYATKWQVKEERAFNTTEKAQVESIEVVASEYGKSACFFMKGGQCYIPLDKESEITTPIGAKLNIDKLTVVILERPGDADIKRIKVH